MWICKNCGEENEDSFDTCYKCLTFSEEGALMSKEYQKELEKERDVSQKITVNKFTLKNILSFVNGFLFLIFLIFSFTFPPRVGFGVLGRNYDGFDAFFAVIKNTFRSWFGQSLDLDSGYYLMPFDSVDSVSDFFEFLAINFAYLIPYLMGGFIIYNLFKSNEETIKKIDKH